MKKRKPANSPSSRGSRKPVDEATRRLMLEGVFRFHQVVESGLRKWGLRARDGQTAAFQQLRRIVESLEAEISADARTKKGKRRASSGPLWAIRPGLLIAVHSLDQDTLKQSLREVDKTIAAWKLGPRDRDERPQIILGPPEFQIAKEKELQEQARAQSAQSKEQSALDRISEAVRQLLDLFADLRSQVAAELAVPQEPKKPRWTQAGAEEAIRRYIADRKELLEGARAGEPGARKKVPKVFGRNVLVRALRMAAGTVSESNAWKAVAEEFGLSHPEKSASGSPKRSRVGLDIALEKQAEADNTSASDESPCGVGTYVLACLGRVNGPSPSGHDRTAGGRDRAVPQFSGKAARFCAAI